MTVINFSHPITGEQLAQLEALFDSSIVVKDVPVQVDLTKSIAEQAETIIEQVGWSANDWQTEKFIVNLPGLSTAAAALLAAIHGRCGYFPPVIVMRREEGAVPRFVISEVVNLQALRDSSRERRF